MANDLSYDIYRGRVERLRELDYNYDEKVYHASKDKKGWRLDHYESSLVIEPPGEPGPAFAAVKKAILLYQFADPRLIRAVFDADAELAGRNMLLLAKFAGFHFEFGVRVTQVLDMRHKNGAGHEEQIWGYAYRTLRGHFEIGEIRFEVVKNIATGEVSFKIDAYSRADRIPNFFYRVGFKLFGRTLQKHFAHSSIRRLRHVARRALAI